MNCRLLLFTLISFCSLTRNRQLLSFNTSKGHIIKINKGIVMYDGKVIYRIDNDLILYNNYANRIIEDHQSIFLFIAIDNSPNLDETQVYLVHPQKAVLIATAMLSHVKDYDNDGFLEFGGTDLTERYPNPDSMYYRPTEYFEIRNGKIHKDFTLTKANDIKLNGLYLSPGKQTDKNNDPVVIPKPERRYRKHKRFKEL